MQEGQLLMTQADRDRLVTLKKAKKKLITQREAAEELGLSTRQVKRLLYALKKRGDKAVVHGLRGKPSNRRIEEKIEKQAVKILLENPFKGLLDEMRLPYPSSMLTLPEPKLTTARSSLPSPLKSPTATPFGCPPTT
jgi:Homeodomain-like domain